MKALLRLALTQCLHNVYKMTQILFEMLVKSPTGWTLSLTPTYFYTMMFYVALLVLRAHSPQTVYMQFSKMSPSVFSLPFGRGVCLPGRQQAERSPQFHFSSLSLMQLWFLASSFVQDVIIDRQTICSALRILFCLSLTSCCSLPLWLTSGLQVETLLHHCFRLLITSDIDLWLGQKTLTDRRGKSCSVGHVQTNVGWPVERNIETW